MPGLVRFLVGVGGLLLVGCSGATSAPAKSAPPAEPRAGVAPVAEAAASLPELTAQEREVADALKRHVTALTEIGERNSGSEWNLAAATDYLARELESLGYQVSRQGFVSGERIAQNLEVEVPGLRLGHQSVVVAAGFDSAMGSPGADDNASGAAALLYLAQMLKSTRAQRSVKLVFLSDAGNRQSTEVSGAHYYLRQFKAAVPKPIMDSSGGLAPDSAMGADPADEQIGPDGLPIEPPKRTIVAMLELRGLGYFNLAPNTQRYPEYLPVKSGSIGQFASIVSYADGAPPPVENFVAALQKHATMPTHHWVLLPSDELVAGSAHRQFAELNIPSMLLFDTHALRTGHFGGAGDNASTLDYERMARLVLAVEAALPTLTGPRAQASGEAPSDVPTP